MFGSNIAETWERMKLFGTYAPMENDCSSFLFLRTLNLIENVSWIQRIFIRCPRNMLISPGSLPGLF